MSWVNVSLLVSETSFQLTVYRVWGISMLVWACWRVGLDPEAPGKESMVFQNWCWPAGGWGQGLDGVLSVDVDTVVGRDRSSESWQQGLGAKSWCRPSGGWDGF